MDLDNQRTSIPPLPKKNDSIKSQLTPLNARPAINNPSSTRHIARHRTAQKQNHIRDLIRVRQPLHHARLRQELVDPVDARKVVYERRLHGPGADGVYPDSIPRVVGSWLRWWWWWLAGCWLFKGGGIKHTGTSGQSDYCVLASHI